VPRSSHASWEPRGDRPDPLTLLDRQASTRVPELVPIRYGRMLASPFAFYRGAAAVMAADLAVTPSTGIPVQLCGDAHLSNFGGFAAPDRRMVFDINDFDETLPGPWEWDVKRLAASVSVAARDCGVGRKARRRIVASAVRAYRTTIRALAPMRNLDVWYLRVEADALIARLRAEARTRMARRAQRDLEHAHGKDSLRALKRLCEVVNGEPRIASDPPLIVPARELLPARDAASVLELLADVVERYSATLRGDVRHVLSTYRLVDCARKVVGVGSVGTRAWILLFTGRDGRDPLFLQAKEADASVLESYLAPSRFRNSGRRVVEGQRLLQPATDVMLGWTRAAGAAGPPADYYVRQLWDWKLSAHIESMRPEGLEAYSELCGATLARAHARSGDRAAIASYLGSGRRFDHALADFAEAYADQNERDYERLVDAVRAGSIQAHHGI
jgi:uncharacterized protein (DUF2252 family)